MSAIRLSFNLREILPSFGCEITARGEQRFLETLCSQGNLGNLARGWPAKLNDLQRFLDVQLSRLPLGIYTAVVVNPVCQVRILLHLAEHHSFPNAVRCARRYEERVIRLDGPVHQELFNA